MGMARYEARQLELQQVEFTDGWPPAAASRRQPPPLGPPAWPPACLPASPRETELVSPWRLAEQGSSRGEEVQRRQQQATVRAVRAWQGGSRHYIEPPEAKWGGGRARVGSHGR